MRDVFSRNVWIALHVGLILLFYVGYMVTSADKERELAAELKASHQKLKYLSVEMEKQLQKKNYEAIEDFLEHWGSGLAEVYEIKLSSDNGFMLGSYQSDQPAENVSDYQAEISYSYTGKAILLLRISRDELLTYRTQVNSLYLIGFLFLSAFLYFLVNTLLRLRLSERHYRQENKIRQATEITLQEREQQLEMTLYSIGDGLIATDAGGRVTHMNPVAEQLTGWDEADAMGEALLSVFNIVNAETRELVDNPVDRVLREGEIVGLANHTVLISKQGDEHQIADSAAPIKDVSGKIFGAILVFRDVTEEYRIQLELANKEDVQQQMLNGMLTFLAILNADGEILFVNKSGLAVGGDVELEEVLGKKLYDIGCWDYSEKDRVIIKDDLEKSQTMDVRTRDIQIQVIDGSLLWIEFHINQIKDEQGQLQYLIAEGSDITARKNAEEQLRRGQKMEALGKLTGGIAHDYNNMLGIIMGYAEMLVANLQQQPELAKYASEIHRSGERGARLTKKLLAFSRKRQAETEIIDLNVVLNDELHMLEKTLTPKIDLQLDLQKDVWLTEMDKGDLEDAVLNVCINAMHAMPESGHLTLSTNNQQLDGLDAEILGLEPGDYVELSITDTGIGMDKLTQARIFDPFFTTKEEGTGLGLSQVYGFVESTGGTVKVYSEPGKGSRIIFLFPRQTNIKDSNVEIQKIVLDDVSGGNETILVVDDEEGLRYLAQEVLAGKGYKVYIAEDAEAALKILEQEDVNLMLSDVIMPGMDGYMLANLVQQRFPKIKIQMVSGFSDDRHLKVFDEHLHQRMLKKPYKSTELLTRIRFLLDEGKNAPTLTTKQPQANRQEDYDSGLDDLLVWTDDMKIGLPAIDNEHKKIHELLLRCLHAQNINNDSSCIKEILDELLDYTQYHFRNEEIIMETCGYPHIENHRDVHKMLVKQAQKHIRNFEQGNFSAKDLLILLKEWFIEHNMGMDRAIAVCAKGKEAEIDEALKNSKNQNNG